MNNELLDVYTIQEIPGRDNYWTNIGTARVIDDAIHCDLYAYPANCKIHIRRKKQEDDDGAYNSIFPAGETLDCVMHLKNRSLRIGGAWINKDGSINASLNVIPQDFKIQIRQRKSNNVQRSNNVDFEINVE